MPKSRRNNQIIAVAAIYTYKKILEKSKQRNRTEWVKQWKQDREVHGHMPLLRQLRENYPDDYKNYLRMDSTTFDKLLELVGPKIVKQDTVMRQSISPEERLTATLRFLATGRSLQDLSFTTGIGTSTLCDLIPETCKAMFESLKGEYMKVSNLQIIRIILNCTNSIQCQWISIFITFINHLAVENLKKRI